jgi:hypothetical protein
VRLIPETQKVKPRHEILKYFCFDIRDISGRPGSEMSPNRTPDITAENLGLMNESRVRPGDLNTYRGRIVAPEEQILSDRVQNWDRDPKGYRHLFETKNFPRKI